jgi:phosphatidylserine decarboxylase
MLNKNFFFKTKTLLNEDLNFLLTNRIPRRLASQFMGVFSKIQHPWVAKSSIFLWRIFSDLDLSEAKKTKFNSLHECFIRELKEGIRPISNDLDVIASPSDAIVGASGKILGTELIQAKGFPYSLYDLLADDALVNTYKDGLYITLRLTATMYHHFHSPCDGTIQKVTYIYGDTWNVNPIAISRIQKLFCKNERVIIETKMSNGHLITMVPVAAILVASIWLKFINVLLHLKYPGPNQIYCNVECNKGEDLGWFQHGSTIIVFAPKGFKLSENIQLGQKIKMGEPLMKVPRG